jgi:hypothetical protein
MSRSKQPKHVFLIYAHSDKKAVHKLYRHLIRDHVKTWLDEKELMPGQNWKHEIRQAILRSDFVVICLSKQFNKQGGFRHEELRIALGKAKTVAEDNVFLIPARLERCHLPEAVHPWQCVDLYEVDGYKKLLKTLKQAMSSA